MHFRLGSAGASRARCGRTLGEEAGAAGSSGHGANLGSRRRSSGRRAAAGSHSTGVGQGSARQVASRRGVSRIGADADEASAGHGRRRRG